MAAGASRFLGRRADRSGAGCFLQVAEHWRAEAWIDLKRLVGLLERPRRHRLGRGIIGGVGRNRNVIPTETFLPLANLAPVKVLPQRKEVSPALPLTRGGLEPMFCAWQPTATTIRRMPRRKTKAKKEAITVPKYREIRFRVSAHWAARAIRARSLEKGSLKSHPIDGDTRDSNFDRRWWSRWLEALESEHGLPELSDEEAQEILLAETD